MSSSSSKMETTTPTVVDGGVTVHVASTAAECDALLDALWPAGREPAVLGFDAEYAADRRVALVQLAAGADAVLVRLCAPGAAGPAYVRALPRALERVLACGACWKAGVGVHDDCGALARQYAPARRPAALLDVAAVALAYGVARARRGLGDLARDILGTGKAAAAPPAEQQAQQQQQGESPGGWARAAVLSAAQQRYAARDAVLGARLAHALYEALRRDGAENEAAFCARAAEAAAAHVETHGARFDREHRDGAAARRSAHVPRHVRAAAQARRAESAGRGACRRVLCDFAKRRDKRARDEHELAAALDALRAPPAKQPCADTNGGAGDAGDGGLVLNIF